jgi:hypothetical protein
MKHSVLLFSLLCIFNAINAQEKKSDISDIPKKTNTITVYKEGTALQILTDLARHLQDNGYSIEKLDKDLLSLSTDYKTFKFQGVAVMKIVAFVRQVESKVKIELKGKVEVTSALASGNVPFDACKCGLVGDARLNSFKEMLEIVEKFNYLTIEFSIK